MAALLQMAAQRARVWQAELIFRNMGSNNE
jgi:hypothetical protein